MRAIRFMAALSVFTVLTCFAARAHAHAVLLMEEPYGFYGTVIPTGHTALYFEQVCAETPIKLRRCLPGELGSVITRYPGIAGYDWVAIPLLPYLYAVETPAEVPAHADRQAVWRMRLRYHERHLLSLGEHLIAGDLLRGGWALLVGMSYERRIYAFSFETTAAQDDALISQLNAGKNRSHFHYLYNNCADFARIVLNIYFPHSFRRNVFVDAGITTPKSITRELLRYAHKHPEMELKVFEIPQVPGMRRGSRPNKGITESLATTAYALPIAAANPYVAGGLFLDYLVRGRFHVVSRNHQVLAPDNLVAMTAWNPASHDSRSVGTEAAGADESALAESNRSEQSINLHEPLASPEDPDSP
jgi:hypothetical protein